MKQWDPVSLVLTQYIENPNYTSVTSRVGYLYTQSLLQLGSGNGVPGLKLPKMHFRILIQNNTPVAAVMQTRSLPRTNSISTTEPVDWRTACMVESKSSFPKSQEVVSNMAGVFCPTQGEKPFKDVSFASTNAWGKGLKPFSMHSLHSATAPEQKGSITISCGLVLWTGLTANKSGQEALLQAPSQLYIVLLVEFAYSHV